MERNKFLFIDEHILYKNIITDINILNNLHPWRFKMPIFLIYKKILGFCAVGNFRFCRYIFTNYYKSIQQYPKIPEEIYSNFTNLYSELENNNIIIL